MFLLHRSTASLLLLSCLLLPLASCANSGWGDSLQKSLAADPKLTATAQKSPTPTDSPSPETKPSPAQAQLPADFPGEIPRYPNAQFQAIAPASQDGNQPQDTSTQWTSQDSSSDVLEFYKKALQADGWKLEPASLLAQPGALTARRNNLLVTVNVQAPASASPSPSPGAIAPAGTAFTLQYRREGDATAQAPTSPTPSASPTPSVFPTPSPSPTNLEAFLGIEGTSDGAVIQTEAIAPNVYTDLGQAPKELQPPLTQLAQLGVLDLTPSKTKNSSPTTFSPNKPVSRREFARWLFAANNRLFSDRPAQQIRPGQNAAQPVFRDVPASDPDFEAIQGLAEAGIIPSSLSGDLTAVTFRPDAQLSRETMLLWKVPMDTRQPLPVATLEAIKQTWAFQDAARIDPQAQRAVLADYQNGDLSNIRRVLGYTTLFQPKKAVTRAEAAASLGYFGYQGDGVSAQQALKAQAGT